MKWYSNRSSSIKFEGLSDIFNQATTKMIIVDIQRIV